MTRAITSGELALLRSNGQWSKASVIVDAPSAVYTARATGAVSKADFSIAFDGGSGTLGDCKPEMILLIGSTAGGYDVGIARLRKDPIAGTFYIGADPSIVVEDDDYLTVVSDIGIIRKTPGRDVY